ncbi:MAG: M28 family metallopeptidase [Anaerolineae bacterium]
MRVLAGEIGPRGTGTHGEAAAADFVARRLAQLGLSVEWQRFRAVADQNAFPLAVNLVALLAVALYPLGGALTRWVAAALALSTPVLFWETVIHSDSPLRPLLPHVRSQNVLGRIPPAGKIRQRVVLLAHLDTNRCRLAWQSAAVRFLEPLTWLTFGVLVLLGVLYLLGALLSGPAWVWWLSLLPAGYILGTGITLWREGRTPFSPGAHDNASSVAVALEVGRWLAARPPRHTEVWLAFTGAEETDHRGLKVLLQEHGAVLRDAVFIDLEGVGSGELVYLVREGLCWPYRPDPGLQALAEEVAARRPDLGVRPARMPVEDEVRTLRNGGYRAICLAGRDPATGTLPRWHRADDTVDTVSPVALERAAEFVLEMLQVIDSGLWGRRGPSEAASCRDRR